MSPTIITSIVTILAFILPLFRIEIGTEQLTNLVQAILPLILAIIAYFERRTLVKAPLGHSDVNALGMRR